MSSNEFPLNDGSKRIVHRRIGSFPSFDNLVTRGRQMLSFPNESSSIPATLAEETTKVRFISSTALNEDQIDDETLNSSTIKRNDHRRNLSDPPMTSASLEDLTSTKKIDRLSLDESRIHDEKLGRISANATPTSKKRKPWYKSFQTTYEERCHEFRKFFRDLPSDDRLVADYSCAWQRDILVHGRMYLSTTSLCFYSNILVIKANFILKWKDIVGITREKTVKVIPNAIEIKTRDSNKYFFTTFNTRDKTFHVIEDLWKAMNTDQPIPAERLSAILHDNYGNDCDLEIDEDIEEISLPTSNDHHENVATVITNEMSTDQSIDEKTPTPEMILNEQPILFLSRCPCEDHFQREFINQKFSISVDQLFDFIFGDNERLKDYRIARRISEYRTDRWHFNAEQNRQERLCTYKVTVSAVFGTMVMTTNETQFINSQMPKSYYIVTTEIRNEGAKYADSFYVITRYCFTQLNRNETNLRVTSEVKYIKSVISFAKTLIEKNTYAALNESFNDLMKRITDESRTIENSVGESRSNPAVMPAEVVMTSTASPVEPSSSITERRTEEDQTRQNLLPSSSQSIITTTTTNTEASTNYYRQILIIILFLLLIVNIYLCSKLNQIDRMTDRLLQSYPPWFNDHSSQSDQNQWSLLLQRQEEYYQRQLSGLQSVLTSTHHALRNVTETLNRLSKLNNGSS